MEGAAKDDKEPPLLKIDPKCLQDALRTFFQPIKTDDPRLDFYTMYKREATEYDTDYVKKYDEDLNTTLIFAGLFSAVSSAFVIDVHSNLQPDPNERSAALLRAILLTLNQSVIPGETPTVPPAQENTPSEIVTVTCLMYASLMISLLAAFVAMLGKQWLNRYLRNSGGSVIERCGDRQRKCDGLEKWPFHSFVESLPLMLQAALLLLACGLCRHMWSINVLVARTLVSLTGLGITFYIAIVIAGMSSYACPFQTPASIALHGLWKKVRSVSGCIRRVRRGIVSSIVRSKRVLSRTHRMWKRRVRLFFHRPSLPAIPLEDVESVPIPDNPSRSQSPSALGIVPQPEPWLKPKELDIIRRTNASDARCLSWILRNITDPEALDVALPVAGEIRWFHDGVDVDLPYDVIVSTFESCFDSTGRLHPGSRDRAYYSGRAMAWIRTLAMCKSEEFATTFLPPAQEYTTPVHDPDLEHLLYAICGSWAPNYYIEWLLRIDPSHTHPHSQWVSDLLLHHSWANRTKLNYEDLLDCFPGTHETETTIPLPLNTTLNRFLVLCTFLGSPVEEEVLMIRNKSGHMRSALYQLSNVVLSAIDGTPAQQAFIPHVLRDLIKLEYRPENLLLVCLEIGFRHLDFRTELIGVRLTHTEHHRGLVDVVFKSQESESIADLLHAWTMKHYGQAHNLLGLCTAYLVGLHNLVPFSPRLRRLTVRSVEQIGYKGFKGVGVERFIGLLNHLHVTVGDMDEKEDWGGLLLDTIQSSEGTQHLSHLYWEFLVELSASESLFEPIQMDHHHLLLRRLRLDPAHSPRIITSLTEAKEWSKLECWMGIVWMLLPEGLDPGEGDLDHSMTLLFRQRPGAVQKLEQWMEQWSQTVGKDVPESFKRAHKYAHETAQRGGPPIPSADEETQGPAHTLPPVPSQPSSGGNEFWKLLSS